MVLRRGRWLVVAGVVWFGGSAFGRPLDLPATGRFVVFDEAVPDVVSRFCQAVRLRCVIDPGISDRVRGHFTAPDPRSFLDRLSREYHLDWYFDGDALYVTPVTATVSRQYPLDDVSFDRFRQRLMANGIADDRYPVRADRDGWMVEAFGPPRFLELVDQTLAGMKSAGPGAVTIYRGEAVQKVTTP